MPVRPVAVRRVAPRRTSPCAGRLLVIAMCAAAGTALHAQTPPQSSTEPPAARAEPRTLADAQHLFYNARYEAAASLALTLRADLHDLANDEFRSSALLFQLRGLIEGRAGNDRDNKEAKSDKKDEKDGRLKSCALCPALLAAFVADVNHGQGLAREKLRRDPTDEEALFYLGKLDLNYVWLQLGVLRRKTGWDEYWEARRSLDAVLKRNPNHVRARVARAWIDYIVDTKLPWGTRWVLGGGNKKRALSEMREAVQLQADFFSRTEAEFALWDMHVRERDTVRATEMARRLAERFPENPELAAYLEAREVAARNP